MQTRCVFNRTGDFVAGGLHVGEGHGQVARMDLSTHAPDCKSEEIAGVRALMTLALPI